LYVGKRVFTFFLFFVIFANENFTLSYRFSLVQDCARLKTSYARLCVILFPELEKLVPSLQMASVYALLPREEAR